MSDVGVNVIHRMKIEVKDRDLLLNDVTSDILESRRKVRLWSMLRVGAECYSVGAI